ncbi:MAG TPA: hypothetical protein H9984_04025 [Candidatus Parabacteroides faecavium]|nr:hypothetical protein [Candidatus Parabacteroides faecavium]
MNKKFSTLMAAALLAGSFPVVAQNAHSGNGEIPYRSQFVKSASLDQGIFGVKNIESDKWYQLTVNMGDDAAANSVTYVLTQERDYSTGRLYLAVKPIQDATLSHSLWKIERTGQDVNGSYYQFTNKETGYTLTLDHTDAQVLTADQLRNLDNNVNTTEFQTGMLRYLSNEKFDLDPTVVRGCATQWSWNSYKEQTTDRFKHKLLYTHFHAGNKAAAQDSIMALAMVKLPSTTAYDHDQLYVRTIKASAKDFQDADLFDNERNLSLLHIRPVVAGAKVLTAAEVNSVLDGKGTLDFTARSTTPGYERENVENKKGFKYTIFKHNSDEALTVYNNPFDSTWLAVESPFDVLDRRNFDPTKKTIAPTTVTANFGPTIGSNANAYAGYNILFKNMDASTDTYLKVWTKLYEAGQGGNYNSLVVAGYPNDNLEDYVGPMTADIARYHWKVTYYATNDSLVFEPLNASRSTYENDMLVNSPAYYFNTVNKGTAFTGTPSSSQAQAYNKAAGVPVALYAQNIGPAAADVQAYLTVGSPNALNISDNKYAAAPKFDMTALGYPTFTEPDLAERLMWNGSDAGTNQWRVAGDNPAYVTNGADANYSKYSVMTAQYVPSDVNISATTLTYNGLYEGILADFKANDGTQWLRLAYNYTPDYLARTTVADGLYFINLKTNKTYTGNAARKNGSYLAYNHVGRLIYTAENENQDFNNMPATQWVVKQIRCQVTDGEVNVNKTPEVAIYNREYGVNDAPVFQGQLYTTKDGAVYLINHRDYYNVAKSDGKFTKNAFSCGDTLVIKAVENEAALSDPFHGYAELGMYDMDDQTEFLSYSAEHPYYLRYNDKTSDEEQTNTFKYLFENPEGYLAVTNPDNISADVQQSLFEIERIATDEYGYGKDVTYADGKKLPQLKRTVYALKVRDNNTVDNNRKYVCVIDDNTNNQRYAVRKLSEVNGQDVKIAEFYLKSNEVNVDRTKEAYILVDARGLDNVKGDKAANAVDLDDAVFSQSNILDAEISDLVDANNKALWEGRTYIENGWQILEMVNDPDKLYAYDLDNQWNKDFTAFTLETNIRPLYKPVEEVRDVNGNIDIYKRDGMGDVKQKLFEMSTNQYTTATSLTYRKDVNYLGMTSEGIKPAAGKTTAMYADGVVTSATAPIAMPQYMLWVANDSIADGYYCEDYLEAPGHGYFPSSEAADKDDMEHYVYYNGYVSGRMLVNFNDSVAKYNELNKLDEASKFKYNNRTRLGFVEGIHTYFSFEELLNDKKDAFKEGIDKYFTTEVYDFLVAALEAQIANDKLPEAEQKNVYSVYKNFEGGVELVYVLNGTSLEDIRDINGKINPEKLKEAIDGGLIDVKMANLKITRGADKKINGIVDVNKKHRNFLWSFRYTEDDITGPNEGTEFGHEDFLMESSDINDTDAKNEKNFENAAAKIGGYEGAWVGLDGNIPVLRKDYTDNGNHNDLVGTPISEGLNQATIFGMSETEEVATANETISAGNVVVAGVDGAVVVKGAEGKNVIVSTILGKVVANEVVSSDNAQISAPAGIVVVSVDGESFKVVVK